MEWLLIILWLSIINGALGGQYILNWMGNQQRFVGNQPVGVSPGVMTWWRELSKLVWAVIAVTIEVIRGKKIKYLWPGVISMGTIIFCAFTGVIENIGFFYLPRYYSPHLFAPYVNIYLALLPFFGKFLFNAPIRRAHWIGILLVITGLSIPYLLIRNPFLMDLQLSGLLSLTDVCFLNKYLIIKLFKQLIKELDQMH